MSNLIPELRADKDGKLVTRHVRADNASQSSVSLPPPPLPVAQPSEDFTKVQNMLVDVLAAAKAETSTDFDETDDDGEESWLRDEPDYDASELLQEHEISAALKELPEPAIAAISSQMDENPYSDDYEVALLHALTFHRGDTKFIEYLTHFYPDVREFQQDNEELFSNPDVNSYTVLRDHLDWLRDIEGSGYKLPDHPYDASDRDWEIVDSLNELKSFIDRNKAELGDADGDIEIRLARVIAARPESVQRVLELVQERGTTDEELILSVLDTESPSVSDGIL